MKPQLKILKGARTGHTQVFSKSPIALGRHPAADLQFDPDRDLQVSARHALIVRRDDHWYVRDVGSRNGTYVNGHKIATDTRLDDTDQIRLGDAQGPVFEVRLVPDGSPDGITAPAQPIPATQDGVSSGVVTPGREPRPTAAGQSDEARPAGPAPRASNTAERIRIEVGKQTRKHRAMTLTAFVMLLGAATTFVVVSQRQGAARNAEVAAMRARTDSILLAANQAMNDLQGQVSGLEARLRESLSDLTNLQAQLDRAERSGTDVEVDELRRQLADATQALIYQQAAAQVDYATLVEESQQTVAMIWARYADRSIASGTAFAVRPNGTLVTNRHLVTGRDGNQRPVEIAVKFADSRQVFRARLLATSPDADLAVIRAEGITTAVPVVKGFGGPPTQGDPVAIIGFPMGSELPGAGTNEFARTTFIPGSVSKVLPDLIQLDGYGVQGASGSPIFDEQGLVIGVLFGGEVASAGRIVYAVPAALVEQLLRSVR